MDLKQIKNIQIIQKKINKENSIKGTISKFIILEKMEKFTVARCILTIQLSK